jgi:D-erythro-7,8-dihydroneopterin triphosphate epimerase
MIANIQIKNLRLRTYIGINPEELKNKQDVVLNIKMSYQADQAALSDSIEDAFNYRSVTKRVIQMVESQRFGLLEKLATDVLNLVSDHAKVLTATVEVDKPHALRFADSVSLSLSYEANPSP